MRLQRIQIALEAVLLKTFAKPHQVLERNIIQSNEFRSQVLTNWAKFADKKKTAYTPFDIGSLCAVKVMTCISTYQYLY